MQQDEYSPALSLLINVISCNSVMKNALTWQNCNAARLHNYSWDRANMDFLDVFLTRGSPKIDGKISIEE